MTDLIREALLMVYEPAKCWYKIKAVSAQGAFYPERLCHEIAGHYRARKSSSADDPTAYMWLCDKHVKALERAGYVVTKVPAL